MPTPSPPPRVALGARAFALLAGIVLALVGAEDEARAEPLVLGRIRSARPRPRIPRHHHRHHHSSATPTPDTGPVEDRLDFSMKLDGGYEVGRIEGEGTGGGRWGVGFGVQNDGIGGWGTLRGRIAPASIGVRAWDVRLGADADVFRSGPLHVGAGMEVGMLERASVGSPLPRLDLTFGLGARVGVDLVRFGDRDRSALTLDVRGDLELLGGGGSYATVGLLTGLRF